MVVVVVRDRPRDLRRDLDTCFELARREHEHSPPTAADPKSGKRRSAARSRPTSKARSSTRAYCFMHISRPDEDLLFHGKQRARRGPVISCRSSRPDGDLLFHREAAGPTRTCYFMQKQPAQRGPTNSLTWTCYFIQKHPAGLATYFVLIEHLCTPDRGFSGRGAVPTSPWQDKKERLRKHGDIATRLLAFFS